MLTRLTIRNYQKHRDLVVNLAPVVAITGPTDAGKSSVIRALQWLCQNRPDGQAFIHRGSKETTVELQVDGHSIVRTRGNDTNTYALDGKPFEAFGRGNVPPEIAQLLNINDVNFQTQHPSPGGSPSDPLFWFSLSAGEVSRQLNAIVDLGQIDAVLSYLNAVVREANSRKSLCHERLEIAREQKRALAAIKSVDADLKTVEALHQNATQTATIATLLHEKVQRAATIRLRSQNALKSLTAVQKDFAHLEGLYEQHKVTSSSVGRLAMLLAQAGTAQAQADKAKTQLTELQTEFDAQMKRACPLCGRG